MCCSHFLLALQKRSGSKKADVAVCAINQLIVGPFVELWSVPFQLRG
uniref:Uncharacterized protein n=1 Tax=Anguilla anguilla TaxID=7936 RepID=A0A0E9WLV4_ANGAN